MAHDQTLEICSFLSNVVASASAAVAVASAVASTAASPDCNNSGLQ